MKQKHSQKKTSNQTDSKFLNTYNKLSFKNEDKIKTFTYNKDWEFNTKRSILKEHLNIVFIMKENDPRMMV